MKFTHRGKSYAFVWMYAFPEDSSQTQAQAFYLLELPPDPVYDPNELLWEQLHVILDSIHDGIWIIDGNGITVHVNKALKRIADITPEDVIGKHVTVPMREGKFSFCVTLQALKEKRSVTLFDDYASGKRCLNTSTPIFDHDGNVWRVVASIRDITELDMLQSRLVKTEQEIRAYKRRLDMLGQESGGFLAGSLLMRNCLHELEKAARSSSGVLILGETGTGKSLTLSDEALFEELWRRLGLSVVSINEIPIGNYGDLSMFSFHATKVFKRWRPGRCPRARPGSGDRR